MAETEATDDIGMAFATSIFSREHGPGAAFKMNRFNSKKVYYWSSKANPEMPVFLWFRFNEIKRVSRIVFEELANHKMIDDDAYQVFI